MVAVSTSKFCKQAANSFWDFPSTGVNVYRIFQAANDFFGSSVRGAILDWNKAPMLSGSATTVWCFNSGLQPNDAPPVVLDTNSYVTFLSPGGSFGGSSIRRYKISTSSSSPPTDTIDLTIPDVAISRWTAPPDAPQPNGVRHP
jgi:hypothetical protein